MPPSGAGLLLLLLPLSPLGSLCLFTWPSLGPTAQPAAGGPPTGSETSVQWLALTKSSGVAPAQEFVGQLGK